MVSSLFREVVFSVKSVLNKTCCELNPPGSVIPAITHKLINCYVTYSLYIYLSINHFWFVYVFSTQLGKISINVVASVHFVRK